MAQQQPLVHAQVCPVDCATALAVDILLLDSLIEVVVQRLVAIGHDAGACIGDVNEGAEVEKHLGLWEETACRVRLSDEEAHWHRMLQCHLKLCEAPQAHERTAMVRLFGKFGDLAGVHVGHDDIGDALKMR